MRGPTRMLVPVLMLAPLAPAAPALAHHDEGPCDIHRQEDETVRNHMKRVIRCAVERWDVDGGVEKALCIAIVESDLNPEAVSADGTYLGLYQHRADAWPDRYDAWTQPAWELDEDALSGRTNAIVTIRMVSENGWGAWSDVGDCGGHPSRRPAQNPVTTDRGRRPPRVASGLGTPRGGAGPRWTPRGARAFMVRERAYDLGSPGRSGGTADGAGGDRCDGDGRDLRGLLRSGADTPVPRALPDHR